MEWRCDSFMTNEKITAMPVKKKQIHLTATLSLPLRLHERAWILTGSRSLSTSLVQQILEVYYLTYARRPAEIEVMCA